MMTNQMNRRRDDLEWSDMRFIDIRSWKTFKEWWNKRVPLRVKGIAYTLFVSAIIILGGQYQIAHVNAANLNAVCETRADGREDLREALYAIVDLNDVFPDSEAIDTYTSTRTKIIDALIDPEEDREGCSA